MNKPTVIENQCPNKAEYLVPWGGKQVIACEEHAKQLTILGNVIGQPVQVAKVAMEDKCSMPKDEK